MNTRKVILAAFSLSTMALFSCGGSKKERSRTTGWNYNDKQNGGVMKLPYVEQSTGPGLVLIEGGTFSMGRTEQDLLYANDNNPRRVTVASFYIDQTEVTNQDYRDYTSWLNKVYAADHKEVVNKAMPDTLVWRERLAYNEQYVENYFRQPAFNDYPVVGINWVQANDYASWRTDRVNEQRMVEKGLLKHDPNQKNENTFHTKSYYAGQYEGTPGKNKLPDIMASGKGKSNPGRKAKPEDGIMLPEYRLPTEAEWEFAAAGLIGNSKDENVFRRRIYPWNGHVVRSAGKKTRGVMMANFVRGRGDYMGVAGKRNDKADITAPVISYFPNDYGLYNMGGNVAEWVLDVYRPMTPQDEAEFNPFRGNVFKKIKTDADGGVAQKNELGEIEYDLDTNTAGRRNYDVADNRDYDDGDRKSSVFYGEKESIRTPDELMYGYGKSTLVSNKSKVFKGGSWKDRAYYLSPGVRRHLEEDVSTNFIGFRCAMTRIGPLENAKRSSSKRKK